MDETQRYDRTISFDATLLTKLNEYALRQGLPLEQWLPEAIDQILIPALEAKYVTGLTNIRPGIDFDIPFSPHDFLVPDDQRPPDDFDQKAYQITSSNNRYSDLRGGYNRLFPVVFCVRIAALYSRGGEIDKKTYYSKLRIHAYQVRLSLMKQMSIGYRQRGPYDGLPAHRSEPKTRTAKKEETSWRRFVRYFADVVDRKKGGGLAQRLGFISTNQNGNLALTEAGWRLAQMENPILDGWSNVYDEAIIKSTLSNREADWFLRQIKHTHPKEEDKMSQLIHLIGDQSMSRFEILDRFDILDGMSTAKKSAELNGLLGRMIDLQLIDKQTDPNFFGDGRSSKRFMVKKDKGIYF